MENQPALGRPRFRLASRLRTEQPPPQLPPPPPPPQPIPFLRAPNFRPPSVPPPISQFQPRFQPLPPAAPPSPAPDVVASAAAAVPQQPPKPPVSPSPPPSPSPRLRAATWSPTPSQSPKFIEPPTRSPPQSPKPRPSPSPPRTQLKLHPEPEPEPQPPAWVPAQSKTAIEQNGKRVPRNHSISNGNEARSPAPAPPSQEGKNGEAEISGIRVLTMAGENRGAHMDLGGHNHSRSLKHGNGYRLHHNLPAQPRSETDDSKKEKEEGTKAKTKLVAVMVNSNVQGVNNSMLFNTSCTHHDPGVHVTLSSGNHHPTGPPPPTYVPYNGSTENQTYY